jgi:Concanavalin A-like lectin/glucanases superfamily/Secretion system C-terminal sorting domain
LRLFLTNFLTIMKNCIFKILIFTLISLNIAGQNSNFSLAFDGFDDAAELPQNEGIMGSNFTIEGWFKCEQTGQVQCLLLGFADPQISSSTLAIEVQASGYLRFVYREQGGLVQGVDFFSNQTVDDNQWYHFAYIKEDNRILKMYLNGVLENAICLNAGNIPQPLFIDLGINRLAPFENFRPFLGHIDDFKIWIIAKSNREIYNDFLKENSGLEEELYSNYKFDVKSDTVFDCSVFQNHGIRIGNGGNNNKPIFSSLVPTLVDVDCGYMFVGTNEELERQGDFVTISPSPASNEVFISLKSNSNADAQIFSNNGKLLQKFKIHEGKKTLSIAQFSSGIYELRVVCEGNISVSKLVKI